MMNASTYSRFRDLIHDRSGIDLGTEKQTLLCGRISNRMRELNCRSYEEYLDRVVTDLNGEEVIRLLDSITTHHTYFFRESEHLLAIRDLVAARLKSGQRRFRIWSAACSSGEEVWSLGMVLLDLIDSLGLKDVDLRFLATDISTKIIRQAAQGSFPASRVESVKPEYRQRHFLKSGSGQSVRYTIRERLRETVLFRRLNLTDEPFPMRGPFDAILCRNVMIYFSEAVRTRLVTRCVDLLSPGSLFCVGMTESILGMTPELTFCGPSTYRKATVDPSDVIEKARRT